METNLNERVAVIESEIDNIKQDQKLNSEDHEMILSEVREISGMLNKYKSFFGGVIFIVGAIWAFVDSMKGWLINHIK